MRWVEKNGEFISYIIIVVIIIVELQHSKFKVCKYIFASYFNYYFFSRQDESIRGGGFQSHVQGTSFFVAHHGETTRSTSRTCFGIVLQNTAQSLETSTAQQILKEKDCTTSAPGARDERGGKGTSGGPCSQTQGLLSILHNQIHRTQEAK